MQRLLLLLMLPLMLGVGCTPLPQDTEGTLDRVQRTGTIRVGVVGDPWPDRGRDVQALLDRITRSAGARHVGPGDVRSRATEPLLLMLDRGELDLVVGIWNKNTPWAADVSLAPSISGTDAPLQLRAAVRNGENRWAMLVEQASREQARAGDVR